MAAQADNRHDDITNATIGFIIFEPDSSLYPKIVFETELKMRIMEHAVKTEFVIVAPFEPRFALLDEPLSWHYLCWCFI